MFGLIRIILGGLLWLSAIFLIRKTDTVNKKSHYIFTAVIVIFFTTLLAFFPFENALITFKSPEEAYKYYNIGVGNVELVASGKSSDLVVGEKDDTDVYLIIPRVEGGWKIGLGIDTNKILRKTKGTTELFVYQYKDTDDYYIVVFDYMKENLDIIDSHNSQFRSITKRQNQNSVTRIYFSSVDGLDDYWIIVNDKKIECKTD